MRAPASGFLLKMAYTRAYIGEFMESVARIRSHEGRLLRTSTLVEGLRARFVLSHPLQTAARRRLLI